MVLELASIETAIRQRLLRRQAVIEILHQAAQTKAHSLVEALAHVELRLKRILFRTIRLL